MAITLPLVLEMQGYRDNIEIGHGQSYVLLTHSLMKKNISASYNTCEIRTGVCTVEIRKDSCPIPYSVCIWFPACGRSPAAHMLPHHTTQPFPKTPAPFC